MADDILVDPDNIDWTKCFGCNNDEFEIIGPGVLGRVKLRCPTCRNTFSKPLMDIIKQKNGRVKLLPSRGLQFSVNLRR